MEFGQVHHIEYYVNDLKKSNLFWSWFLQKLGFKKYIAFMDGTLAELDQLQAELDSWKIKIIKCKDEYLCFEDPNDFAVEVYAKSEGKR